MLSFSIKNMLTANMRVTITFKFSFYNTNGIDLWIISVALKQESTLICLSQNYNETGYLKSFTCS